MHNHCMDLLYSESRWANHTPEREELQEPVCLILECQRQTVRCAMVPLTVLLFQALSFDRRK